MSIFRTLPGAVLLACADEPTLHGALEFMRIHDAGPSFVRYPRDAVAAEPFACSNEPFVIGKSALAVASKTDVPDLAILAYGTTLYAARDGLAVLREHGHDVTLYDARFAKPVDTALLKYLLDAGTAVLSVEDHFAAGGFDSAVLEAASDAGLDTRLIGRCTMPEAWVGPASRDAQLADAGLDAGGIAATARELLARRAGLTGSLVQR